MVNAVNERVLTRVCRNHEIGVTCYVAGVALSEKYSRFTVPFACIRGNVVERRPYTAALYGSSAERGNLQRVVVGF